MDVPVKAYRILVSGKVQGVFYRKYTQQEATRLGLRGWVANLDDGRVEIVAEGPEVALRALLSWCHRGSPKAKVSAVSTEIIQASGLFQDFSVRHGYPSP
jgi:acylphosphatase